MSSHPSAAPAAPGYVWAQTQTLLVPAPMGVAVATVGSGTRVFVTSDQNGSVYVFDGETLEPIGQPVAVSRFNGVSGIAVGASGSGTRQYVFVPTILQSEQEMLTVLDAETLAIVSTATAVGAPLWSVAISPANGNVFIACQPGGVYVFDATTFQPVGQPITVGQQPNGVAFSPDGSRAWVANLDDSNSVSVIDAVALTVIATLPGFSYPDAVAVSADGARVFVANMGQGTVMWIDATATPPRVMPTPIVSLVQPIALAVLPDGSLVFVADRDTNSVTAIDAQTLEVVGQPIPVGTTPGDIAVAPDSKRVFVTNTNGTVSVIGQVPIQTDPLLDYAIEPTPNPLTASFPGAELTLIISNGGTAVVNCTRIIVNLPVGENASDLTSDPTGIQTTAPAGWSVSQDGGLFTLTPDTPGDGNIGGQGLPFLFTNVQVNDQPSAYCPVTIFETAAAYPQPSMARTKVITMVKSEEEFTLSDLTADPVQVAQDGTPTLNWTGAASTDTMTVSYKMNYSSGTEIVLVPVGNNGPYVSEPLTQTPSVTFTLAATVTWNDQNAIVVQKQSTVTVQPAAVSGSA